MDSSGASSLSVDVVRLIREVGRIGESSICSSVIVVDILNLEQRDKGMVEIEIEIGKLEW